jgi:hypothetical protein
VRHRTATHTSVGFRGDDDLLVSRSRDECGADGRAAPDIGTGESRSLNLSAKLGQMQLITDRIVAVTDVMSVVSFVDLDTMELLRAYEVPISHAPSTRLRSHYLIFITLTIITVIVAVTQVTSNGCGNNCTFVINETKLGAGMGNGPVAGHFTVFDLALDTGEPDPSE